jgi:ABC-type transport system substrate-binding protein
MRIKSIFFVLITLLFSMPLITVNAVPKTSPAPSKNFVAGTWVASGWGDWDPPIYISLPNNYYLQDCLENLVWTDFEGISHPLLATNWTIYPRLDEGGHTGGVKAIALSLRQGVKFHDDSDWNATVAKWNMDRWTVISGNLTGTGDAQNRDFYWFDASQWDSEFTANWNVSWYKSNPYGLGSEIPIINSTSIINNYLINVTFNTWANDVSFFASEGTTMMISKQAYNPWTNEPIYGIGENPKFPQNNPAIFPGHLIGTGPYKFDYYEEAVTSLGHLIKNDNYWNKTALESAGLFSITDVFIRHYADFESRTTALLTGEIDYSDDLAQVPITDHDAVLADPLLKYDPAYLDPSVIDITFKCEEGLNTPTPPGPPYYGMTPKQLFQSIYGFPLPDGVNRTVRKALSYSFDYQTYFDVVQNGWGNITQSCLGLESIYYNENIQQAYYNVTKAREILLSDPYYAGLAATRGLTISNTTQEWNIVASSNPIGTHNMMYTTGSSVAAFMEAALHNIGFGFVGYDDPNVWVNQVATGQIVLYDMFPFIWPLSTSNPWFYLNAYFSSTNRVIPYFGYNFNFLANSTIDDLLTQIYFSGNPQPLYDQLAYDLQNYHVPLLYLCQYQEGFGINIGWKYTSNMAERIGFGGLPYYAWIYGDRTTGGPTQPFIPGYDTTVITLISLITIFGLAYVGLKRKKSFASKF